MPSPLARPPTTFDWTQRENTHRWGLASAPTNPLFFIALNEALKETSTLKYIKYVYIGKKL